MTNKELITTYYINAREQIRLNNPLAARKYVLMILNAAVKTYYAPGISILLKVKTSAFLDKWLAVSRDLYSFGITDYVAECFGFSNVCGISSPSTDKKAGKKAEKSGGNEGVDKGKILPDIEALLPDDVGDAKAKQETSGDVSKIDIAGILEDAEVERDWGAEVFEANKSAVVKISAASSGNSSIGTGFIISDNGYLLTNDHVVYDEVNHVYQKKLKMSLTGEKKTHKLDVIISDKKSDVALCRFIPEEVEGFTKVKCVPDYSKVRQGAECLVIGNAFGMGLAPCIGYIRFTKNDSGNLVYTVPTNPGDSGGPVFNKAGECIGINKSKTIAVNGTAAEGYANATPMDKILEILKKWTEVNEIVL